jgi:hypothetical protein
MNSICTVLQNVCLNPDASLRFFLPVDLYILYANPICSEGRSGGHATRLDVEEFTFVVLREEPDLGNIIN